MKAGLWMRAALAITLMGAAVAMPGSARAADEPECGIPASGIPEGVVVSLDPFGVRKSLATSGAFGGAYYGELFASRGGQEDGSQYQGVLELHVDADLKKLGFWKGLCFHANGYQIHGNSISAGDIGNLAPVSSVEATPSTRLFELWFEQHMLNDTVQVRIGQLAADTEFILSKGGSYFLNGSWGWPTITAADLPSGGPAYPLATPGVRLAIGSDDPARVIVGLYNGDPVGPDCIGDPMRCNDDGLHFRLEDPPLLLVEGHYTYNREKDQLQGTVKLGGFNHFGDFAGQRIDVGGGLIGVSGLAGRVIDGNHGFYAIIDQLIWRVPGSEQPQGVGLFGRIMGAPGDRNLVDFYADAGITFTGLIPGRPNDAFAVGFQYAGISDRVGDLDRDSGSPVVRDHEAVIEICYTYQIKPGWNVQPDFQYFFDPGGGVTDASGVREVDDVVVVGARTSLNF